MFSRRLMAKVRMNGTVAMIKQNKALEMKKYKIIFTIFPAR